MSLKEQIDDAIKLAMKARDKVRLETVRSIKKLLLEKEVEARGAGLVLGEAEELAVVMLLAKQRRDSVAQYRLAGREDLAAVEALELAILEEYLPAQLSEAEVRGAIGAIIAELGAAGPKDMGRVMGVAMVRLKGQVDGGVVQTIVKKLLG
jgi:uncharacterized protein